MSKQNIHDGHRERLRDRYLNTGLSGFHTHEVIELLLFYAIPRADTNRIAHDLLRRFGSLDRVFDADIRHLREVDGIGENAALFLTLIPDVCRRYLIDAARTSPGAHDLISPERACQFVKILFTGYTHETFLIVCLDNRRHVIHHEEVSHGSVNSVTIDTRRVAKIVLEQNAAGVILAHNHPEGLALPSRQDAVATDSVAAFLRYLGVALFDHIIVGKDDVVSFASGGKMLPPIHPDTFTPYF